jgi:hypothetical protein
MPQSIPKGLTRECVLQALADLDAGIEHPFGPPTGYELVHEGKRYAPKAVIGLACRSLLNRTLLPEEVSGGKTLGQRADLRTGQVAAQGCRASRPSCHRMLPWPVAECPGSANRVN